MTEQLTNLIKSTSAKVEMLFRKSGQILPMYDATKSNGERMVIPAPPVDKNLSVMLIKALFALESVDHYVYIDEAWILDTTSNGQPIDLEQIRREGVRNHPDRREVVMFMAENCRGEILTGRRYILRPEHSKAKLAPLQIDDLTNVESSGRMIGLLREENK